MWSALMWVIVLLDFGQYVCLHVLTFDFFLSHRVIIREPKPTAPAPSWTHQAPTPKFPRGHWPPSSTANHSKANNQPANQTTHLAAVDGSRGSSVTLAPPGGKAQTAAFQRKTRTGERRPLAEVRTVTIKHYPFLDTMIVYTHVRVCGGSSAIFMLSATPPFCCLSNHNNSLIFVYFYSLWLIKIV